MISLITSEVSQRWQPVAVHDVVVEQRQREVSADHVASLRASYAQLGGQLQLQPIVLDEHFVLIDGAHRLEAAKQEGWQFIAALIFRGVNAAHRPILEAEANRVRKNLTPVELEAVWREHYEPAYRVRSRRRQLAGLRRGAQPQEASEGSPRQHSFAGVAENKSSRLTLAKAAKQTTGLSIDTLKKITEVRLLAQSQAVPENVREQALRGLQKLSRPHAQVAPVHRQVMESLRHASQRPNVERYPQQDVENVLEKALSDCIRLAKQVDLSFVEGVTLQDPSQPHATSGASKDLLQALRALLARLLATVVSVECKLEDDSVAALRRIGNEVSQLQSRTSAEQLGLAK